MATERSVAGMQYDLPDGEKWCECIMDEHDSPHWIKGNECDCKHAADEYIGTFEYLSAKGYTAMVRSDPKYADVYLRKDNGVCIRHSDKGGDYSGIPAVEMMVDSIQYSEVYRYALKMILRKRFPYGGK